MPHFEQPSADVCRLVDQVIEQYHGELQDFGVTVRTLMVHAPVNDAGERVGVALKQQGFPALAMINATSTRDRACGMADALLQIDGDRWPALSEEQQLALIDHEIEHLELKRDREGEVTYDDRGRPRLRIKPHDHEVHWFTAVVERHGEYALECLEMDHIHATMRQLELPFMEAVG